MRKLASIQRITELKPIEGADRIELARVLGWQVVVGKGQYKPGDLVVYFEIDSFLPVREEFEFLRDRSFKKSELLGEGFRLKTMQLRGEVSQGLIMSINEVLDPDREYHKGDDVTEILGIREWQIPEMASGSGTIIGEASGKIHVTDEVRIQSEPGLLEEFRNLDYYITLKIDGSSHSIKIDTDDSLHVFGHNYELKDDGASPFYEYIKENKIDEIVRTYMKKNALESMTVQGEWCGAGIQKNRLGLSSPEWFVFTVDENDRRTGLAEMEKFISASRVLKMVPLLEKGTDLPSVYSDEASLLKRAATDDSHSYLNDIPEGIVIRPVEPVYSPILRGPLSMKIINNGYLLKNKE